MRHILAPRDEPFHLCTWHHCLGVGTRVFRIDYRSHRFFMEVDNSTTIRTIRTPADLLIMSLEMTARFEVTFAAVQCKRVQVNKANTYNGVNPSFNYWSKNINQSMPR